jgi:hypothetical protein
MNSFNLTSYSQVFYAFSELLCLLHVYGDWIRHINNIWWRIQFTVLGKNEKRVITSDRNIKIEHNVTCIPIARQRLVKLIHAGANALDNRTCIARQRRGKHASSTIEAVSSVWSVPNVYKRTQKTRWSRVAVAVKQRDKFRYGSLPGSELGSRGIEWSRVYGIGSRRIRARKGIRRCKEAFVCDLK